jgi:drug/metabolite transporter (DMT)-like permease
VIVISALDEEISSVITAIELGAEDFLPKNFEPALLNARIATCIDRKRLRDVEKEYLNQVAKLTRAAAALETGHFNPERLGIQEVAARKDGLGLLANVFSSMAQRVYERERKLRQNIRTFRGGLLILVCGVLWGLNVPLSKIAAGLGTHPIGLSLMISLLSAIFCIGISLKRGTLPRPGSITGAEWRYIFQFAFIATVINQVAVFWMASILPAFVVSIVIVLEGFAVFVYATLMKVEAPKFKRFLGLAVGLAGVGLIMYFSRSVVMDASWVWFIVALVIPISFAAEDIYIATSKPARIDSIALFGMTASASVILLLPLAFYFADFVPLATLWGATGIIVLVMAGVACTAMILYMTLIDSTGAVFASQCGYAVTAAGIGWSMALLGEYISPLTWLALGLVVIGLVLVEPKNEAEEEPPALESFAEDFAT